MAGEKNGIRGHAELDRWRKTPMREQPARQRTGNFNEVALGYTAEDAAREAARCLQCKVPHCEAGCPVEVSIKEFIGKVNDGDMAGAASAIMRTNSLPAICGRVCPQEAQCEAKCVLGKRGDPVGIGRLERYVADWFMEHGDGKVERSDRKQGRVAVVGAGPASLTAAGDLARMGCEVVVFEALHVPGGVLMYGIPEFRLPKALVQREIKNLEHMGVRIMTNVVVGKTLTIDELMEEQGYDAVFVGTGAGLPKFLGLPGENLLGVYSANEFLTRVNLMRGYDFPHYDTPVKVGRKVAVIGAGNTAMDSARTALRAGAEEVHIVYRRSDQEMTARVEEYHHAIEEGIVFNWLTNPVRFLGDEAGWLTGMECIKMRLGEPDSSGRRRPVPIEGSEFTMDVETVVLALGTSPNPLVPQSTPGLVTHSWGGIIADEETGATSREGVFAGGDIVTGAATVILAMGAGKAAAGAIDQYLREKLGRKDAR